MKKIRVMVAVDKTDFSRIGVQMRLLGVDVTSISEHLGTIDGKADRDGIKALVNSDLVSFVEFKDA